MRNKVLGERYRIKNRIGEGGMAYVYLGRDEKLGREVAIKVLHEHMETNADIRRRFQMEAQAVSALDHPNIVKIYDFSGDQEGRLWIVTEVIDGKNLAQFVQRFTGGWLHPAVATCIVREICKALEKAHDTGIVHRDIKPENIMVTRDGIVKLMDFGIAKDLGRSSMTVTGTFMGSPSYMSPEQIRGKNVDHRSDVYSLCVLYYEIVTGRLPYSGQTTHDVVMKIMEGKFTYPRFLVPTIPERLDKIIVKGMAKEPDQRFQSIAELSLAIDQFLGSMGFVESHVELERYFRDRPAYEARLAQLEGGFRKRLPRTGPRTAHDSQSKSPSRKTTAESAHHKDGVRAAMQAKTTIPRSQKTALPPPPEHIAVRHREATRAEMRLPPPPTERRSLPPRALAKPKRSTRYTHFEAPPQRDAVEPRRTEYLKDSPVALSPRKGGDAIARRGRGKGVPHKRVPRAPQQRRTTHHTIHASPLSKFLGVVLVGLVGLVATWGFWELHLRLDTTVDVVDKQGSGNSIAVPRTNTMNLPDIRDANETALHDDFNSKLPRKRPLKERPLKDRKDLQETERLGIDRPDRDPGKVAVNSGRSSPADSPAPSKTPATVEVKRIDPPRRVQKREVTEPVAMVKTAPATPTPERSQEIEPASNPEIKADNGRMEHEAGKPDDQKQRPAKGPSKLFVQSNPAAEVLIDGKKVGTTIDQTSGSGWLTLSPGRHFLALRRQGYAMHKEILHLEPGEERHIGPVQLRAATTSTYPLTLSAKSPPVQVVIKNLDSSKAMAFTMTTTLRTIELEEGRYNVKITKGKKTRERTIVLGSKAPKLTFSAEFLEEEE